MMNTSEVAIRCGEHAFTRLQKLLPQQDRLLPKIYQTEDDQYIIYWDSIHWFESSDKREAELVRAFNRAFDYLEIRKKSSKYGIRRGISLCGCYDTKEKQEKKIC